MEAFIKQVTEVNDAINNFVWVKIGLVLLIGTGILLTVLTKFFQVVHIKEWWTKPLAQDHCICKGFLLRAYYNGS